MALLTEVLDLPGGSSPRNVVVTVTLAGTDGAHIPAGYDETGNTIVGRYLIRPEADGSWSLELVRNDQITPSGTAWKIVLSGAGTSSEPRYVEMNGPGPFDVADVLTDPPASVATSTYSELDARVEVLEATSTVDGGDADSALTGSIDGGSA